MQSLSFLADMNISPLSVMQLREKGWKIIRVSEIMDARTKDIDILRYARKFNMVIITNDLDFSELLAIYGFDGPSVINLRLEDMSPAFVTERLSETVPQLADELKEGIVVSVSEISVRFRNLPI